MTGKIAFFVNALLALVFLLPCASGGEKPRIAIVATLFPQYDFARQIAGDNADVKLLLPPGAESHSFEPTPADMQSIAGADIFVYTGEYMEPWAKRLADSAAAPAGVRIVDASKGVAFLGEGEEEEEEEDDHDGHHHHGADPHIWLDPTRAAVMVVNIGQALAEQDPANASLYRKNTDTLVGELQKIDRDFIARVGKLPKRLLVFGDHFAFAYFIDRYRLEAASPYNSCVSGAEPGLRAVIDSINLVKNNGVKIIYVEAMTTSRMANLIASETGAEILYVDSLHNPSAERQQAGLTYQQAMRENMDAFAKGLE